MNSISPCETFRFLYSRMQHWEICRNSYNFESSRLAIGAKGAQVTNNPALAKAYLGI